MGKGRKRRKIDHNSSSDTNNNETDDVIPRDLLNQILQRLPVKSIAKLVRVSKSWADIIRSNYFINSFSLRQSMELRTQQKSHRLLFALNEMKEFSMKAYPLNANDNWSFFSSLSLNQGTDEKEFISRMVVSQVKGRSRKPIYVNGLLNFMFGTTQVISNPSTGKSIVLPLVKSRRKIRNRFFGFDPINGEYKVLCIIESTYGSGSRITSYQNQVLTVGSKCSCLWRELDFWIPHRPHSKGICIDGIIYYLAYYEASKPILVRFDVRSEKFLNQLPCLILKPLGHHLTLINYESKLAIAYKKSTYSFDLWVLEDVENLKWLKISQDVSLLTSLFTGYTLKILGTIPSGEIAYTCYGTNRSFYVIYHDYKKNRIRSVQIKAGSNSTSFYPTRFIKVDGFIDYKESVMLL